MRQRYYFFPIKRIFWQKYLVDLIFLYTFAGEIIIKVNNKHLKITAY